MVPAPIVVSRSGHTGKIDQLVEAVIHAPSPPHKRCLAGCSSPLMRLAATPHVRLALGARNQRLSGRCRDARVYWSLVIRLRPCMMSSTPPPPPPPNLPGHDTRFLADSYGLALNTVPTLLLEHRKHMLLLGDSKKKPPQLPYRS